MKSTLVTVSLLVLLLWQASFAQKIPREEQIVAGEYFIGADPGIGKGTPIPISPSTEVEAVIRDLPLTANQAVHIRFKNAKGRWTAPTSFVYNGTGVNREALVAYAEYFIGADPGRGKGTPLTVSPATELDLNVNSLALAKGQKFHLRVRDRENRWSAPASWSYTGVGVNRAASINYAEYFIGADPGRGKGTKIPISASTNTILKLATVSLPKNDKLHLRIRDADKRWSDPVSLSYPTRFVRNAEIVIGKSPMNKPVGTGTPMNPVDGTWGSAYESIQAKLNTWNFRDSVWVRAQSSDYVWSMPVGDSVAYYPAPTLTKINLATGNRLQTLNVVLTGTNFFKDISKVNFGTGINVNSATANSATQITANITITATAATGPRHVVVTNPAPGGGTATLTNAFTVNNPAPTLSSIAPTNANRGQTLDIVLNGSNFINGVSSVSFGAEIKINSVTVNSATKITANITIGANAATGARNLSIINAEPGGGTATLTNGLTINNPLPTLTSIAPNNGNRGQTLEVILNGSNFINGVTSVSFGTDVKIDSIKINNENKITANITIGDNTATGARNVSVTNSTPGGGTATLANGFTVNNPAPTLISVSPAIGNRLQTLEVMFNGTNFIDGVTSLNVGPGITINSMTVTSATSLKANLTITATAATGARNFSVTNSAPGGGTVTLTNAFTVNNPAPTLISLSPASGNRLQTLDVSFTGANFISGVSSVNVSAGITVNSVTVTSATSLKANLTITEGATTGFTNFSVSNAAPGGGTSGNQVFAVNNPAPTLTKINPSNAKRGQTLNVGCKGTNFINGVSSINVGANITVNSVMVHRKDSLTANLTIGKSASPGPRNFSVTNSAPGGGTSGNIVFTIINNEPTPPKLLAPANKDTIKLVTPPRPLKFVWRKSKDGDAQDTLKYSLNIKGPGLDTTVAGVKDTSLALNIMPRLKVASNYSWTVKVTDGFVTIGSADIFSFRTSDKLTSVDEHFSEIPTAFLIEQNYPNPFNPSTKIRFELPKNVRVSLKIYDMLGHEVAVLVDEEKPAGRYEVVWEPNEVSSGVYLYRLQAGAFVQAKKMILSR